jgi:hypothetical protein
MIKERIAASDCDVRIEESGNVHLDSILIARCADEKRLTVSEIPVLSYEAQLPCHIHDGSLPLLLCIPLTAFLKIPRKSLKEDTTIRAMADITIPMTCKAGVMHNEGPDFFVTMEEVDVPEPGPDEVLRKLNVTGLCFSDLHYVMGDLGALPKMSSFGVRSAGHEGAGTVVNGSKKTSPISKWEIVVE